MTRMSQKNFLRDQSGSATIETVLWLPFFAFFITFFVDVAMIFQGQARALKVIQEANRELSIGAYTSISDFEARVMADLTAMGMAPDSLDTSIVAGVVTTRALIPTDALAVVGLFTALTSFQVGVGSEMMIENWEV